MSLPGKKPIGYIRPLNFPDATGQRGPTGGKRKGDQKDISKSIWGIDHAEPVHKAFGAPEKRRANITGALGGTLGSPATAIYGATQARSGRKAAVAGRVGGRTLAGTFGGGTAGQIAAGALTRGRAAGLGSTVGAVAGGATQGRAAMVNAQRRGDLKKPKVR